jgi:hypothetical protein
MNAP